MRSPVLQHASLLVTGWRAYRLHRRHQAWKLIENSGGIGELSARAGGAYDVSETPETGGRESLGRVDDWGALVGVSLRLSDHRTAMHAGFSRRGRFPSLRELYSGALNRFVPNPDLQPETTISAEAGVSTRSESADVQAVLFHHGVENAIVRVGLQDGRFMRINQNELESFGTELQGSYARGSIGVAGHLVLQDVSLTDSDGGESRKPENMPEVMAGLGAHALIEASVVYPDLPDSGIRRDPLVLSHLRSMKPR